MYQEYSLPPGYKYDLQFDDGVWMAITDRAGDTVLAISITLSGDYYGAIAQLWEVLDLGIEIIGHHVPAFLVWQLDRSPLERLRL